MLAYICVKHPTDNFNNWTRIYEVAIHHDLPPLHITLLVLPHIDRYNKH